MLALHFVEVSRRVEKIAFDKLVYSFVIKLTDGALDIFGFGSACACGDHQGRNKDGQAASKSCNHGSREISSESCRRHLNHLQRNILKYGLTKGYCGLTTAPDSQGVKALRPRIRDAK